VNKTETSATQFAKYILLHAYSTAAHKSFIIAYLKSWHNSIFGYKLRTE